MNFCIIISAINTAAAALWRNPATLFFFFFSPLSPFNLILMNVNECFVCLSWELLQVAGRSLFWVLFSLFFNSQDADRNIKCQQSLDGTDLFHFCLAASRESPRHWFSVVYNLLEEHCSHTHAHKKGARKSNPMFKRRKAFQADQRWRWSSATGPWVRLFISQSTSYRSPRRPAETSAILQIHL